jgi:hypothetical protein
VAQPGREAGARWRVWSHHRNLAFELSLSVAQNLWGAVSGHRSAFVWTGSVVGTATLLFWWFLVPAVTWPVDLYWTVWPYERRGADRLAAGTLVLIK